MWGAPRLPGLRSPPRDVSRDAAGPHRGKGGEKGCPSARSTQKNRVFWRLSKKPHFHSAIEYSCLHRDECSRRRPVSHPHRRLRAVHRPGPSERASRPLPRVGPASCQAPSRSCVSIFFNSQTTQKMGLAISRDREAASPGQPGSRLRTCGDGRDRLAEGLAPGNADRRPRDEDPSEGDFWLPRGRRDSSVKICANVFQNKQTC